MRAAYGGAMIEPHDFQYAMENTRVVVAPKDLIETFGTTSFRFFLVSELMDEVDSVRVRGGRMEAERPRIVSPHTLQKLALDGFGESARDFADWVESNAENLRFLRYGFQIRKTDLQQNVVKEPLESVLGKLQDDIAKSGDPRSALISGVDDAWEVCLLKFTVDLIRRSSDGNVDEWKRRGLI